MHGERVGKAMAEMVVCEEHSQVYEIWRDRGQRGLRLSHVDFHCDMRGLLIDRPRARAYLIDGVEPRVAVVDSGNFIAHAIMEGIVSSIRWVHDTHGGRRYDSPGVKYESTSRRFRTGCVTACTATRRFLSRSRRSPSMTGKAWWPASTSISTGTR